MLPKYFRSYPVVSPFLCDVPRKRANNTCLIPEAMPSEISNNFTFNGSSAAIGCAIGTKQVTITNCNNTTNGVQQSTGESNGVGTSDGSQPGSNDGNGSGVATGSDRDGPGNISPHEGNEGEDDRMFVDQGAHSGQTNQAAHILGNASNVHISGSKIKSIAGSSLKTTSKLVY